MVKKKKTHPAYEELCIAGAPTLPANQYYVIQDTTCYWPEVTVYLRQKSKHPILRLFGVYSTLSERVGEDASPSRPHPSNVTDLARMCQYVVANAKQPKGKPASHPLADYFGRLP